MNRSLIALLIVVALVAGCARRDRTKSTTFDQEGGNYALLIAYSKDTLQDDSAYDFLLRTLDKYRMDRVGERAEVLIARLESRTPIQWYGPPSGIRNKYPNAAAFRADLLGAVKEEAPLSDGLARSLKRLMDSYSIVKNNAKPVAMILSSLEDPMQSPESDQRFLDALTQYHNSGGEITFYYADPLRMEEIEEKSNIGKWRQLPLGPDGKPVTPNFDDR